MMPFITRRRHDAEMAKMRETLAVAALALGKACEERDTLQSRLDALTPARGQGGRFVAKAKRLEPASPPSGATGYGLEDFE